MTPDDPFSPSKLLELLPKLKSEDIRKQLNSTVVDHSGAFPAAFYLGF
jgi:hypothetical protein